MQASTFEERLLLLEKDVAELKLRLPHQNGAEQNWLARMSGSMKDLPEEDFEKFVRLGEEIRKADRPAQ